MKDDLTPADCSPDSLGGMRHVDGADAPFPGPPLEGVKRKPIDRVAARVIHGWQERRDDSVYITEKEEADFQSLARLMRSAGKRLEAFGMKKAATALAGAEREMRLALWKSNQPDGRAEGGTTGASPGNAN